MMSAEEAMAELAGVLPFIRGVTVSGGECTRYPAFLRRLGELVQERGLTFFLDSNGNYDYEGDGALMDAVDAVMLDIKADPENPAEYRAVTGNSGERALAERALGERLLKAADYLARAHKLYEIRTVVSPGLFDAKNTVEKMCRFIAEVPGGPAEIRYKLIRYRPAGVRREAAAALTVPGEPLMEELAAICAGYGIQTVVI
jgi:pyruvate formate lyase activating enzyme